MRFADIPGLNHVKGVLTAGVRRGQVAHTQLFAAPPGGAGLMLAWAYATYLNCPHRTADDACGTCGACRRMAGLVHPDFHFAFPTIRLKDVGKEQQVTALTERWRSFLTQTPYGTLPDWGECLGAENKAPTIPVDEARSIIRRLSLVAYEGPYKIMLMWLPELLNEAAANALLKLLEEPPGQTVFLLVSHQPDQLLTTIRSRAQRVQVPPLGATDVAAWLEQHGAAAETARQLGTLTEGNLREAVHLSRAETSNYLQLVSQWLRHCYKSDLTALLDYMEAFQQLGREGQKGFWQYALTMLREVLVVQLGAGELTKTSGEARQFAERFARTLTLGDTEQISEWVADALAQTGRNASAKMVFLDTSLQLARQFFLVRRRETAAP